MTLQQEWDRRLRRDGLAVDAGGLFSGWGCMVSFDANRKGRTGKEQSSYVDRVIHDRGNVWDAPEAQQWQVLSAIVAHMTEDDWRASGWYHEGTFARAQEILRLYCDYGCLRRARLEVGAIESAAVGAVRRYQKIARQRGWPDMPFGKRVFRIIRPKGPVPEVTARPRCH